MVRLGVRSACVGFEGGCPNCSLMLLVSDGEPGDWDVDLVWPGSGVWGLEVLVFSII